MNGRNDFRPTEVESDGTVDETLAALSVARELEWYRDATDVEPGPGLIDQVMSAVTAEPRPAPLVAAASAIRSRRLGAILSSLRDVWRVAWSGPRPVAVRATALALVAITLVSLGSVGSLAIVGAWNTINPDRPQLVSPSPERAAPTPIAPAPSRSSEPNATPTSRPTAEPAPTPTPTPTPHDGDHGGSNPGPSPAPTHAETPVPGTTHHPDETHPPDQTHAPEPTDAGHSDG